MATVARSMSLGQNLYLANGAVPQSMPYRKRPIAPAPVVAPQPTTTQFKVGKKYCPTALPYAVTPQQSVSIQRRNARERNRVKQVNNGFANLRQHIPATVVTALTNGGRGPHKKLSKVDTLKVAVKYIRSMQRMLEEDIENNGTEPTTTKLDTQALSPVSFYGSMSESSSSPAPSQLSEYSSYSSQPELPPFKREPYDPYPTQTTTVLPSMTTFTTSQLTTTSSTTYSAPIHHVYKVPTAISYTPEEMSPQNTDDEELLDAISWWQQQQ